MIKEERKKQNESQDNKYIRWCDKEQSYYSESEKKDCHKRF